MDKRITLIMDPAEGVPEQLGLRVLADKAFQEHILPAVSRAFACSLPALPESLRAAVANLYLLSRVSEIVSDHSRLDLAAKQAVLRELLAAAEAPLAPRPLTAALAGQLAADIAPADRELIRKLPRILRVTHTLPSAQQRLVQRCLRRLCQTRLRFQPLQRLDGLASLALLEEYCQGTAGAVAEATSSLLCRYSPAIGRHGGELAALGASFGQGLQMTHLLKSLWEDRRRGSCWLPRDVFLAHGCMLDPQADWSHDPGFHAGLAELIGHACGHLRDGLAYTLLIPAREDGIRRFCAWPLGMALVSLQRLHRHLDFTCAEEVKVSQAAVRALVTASRFAVSRNWLLKGGFALAGRGLAEDGGPNPAIPGAKSATRGGR